MEMKMFSILDMRKQEIVRKNIASRKELVWPDGFISEGYVAVGTTHQVTKTNKDGSAELIDRWKLYEDDIENGHAGKKLRLGPPLYNVETDQVIRDIIVCDDFEQIETEGATIFAKLNTVVSLEQTLVEILHIVIGELSLRGEAASRNFKDLVEQIHHIKMAQPSLNQSKKEMRVDR